MDGKMRETKTETEEIIELVDEVIRPSQRTLRLIAIHQPHRVGDVDHAQIPTSRRTSGSGTSDILHSQGTPGNPDDSPSKF